MVIVYAFDCTDSTPAWYTVDNGIFWLLQEKLIHFPESCMGYIYIDMTPNTYTSDMKVVDPNETKETGYTRFAWHRMTCTKNMASGLADAHKMISNHGHHNGIILFFSDGLLNKGDFFDGTENFVSKVPVHTFTLGGDAYNHVCTRLVFIHPNDDRLINKFYLFLYIIYMLGSPLHCNKFSRWEVPHQPCSRKAKPINILLQATG